MSSIKNAAEMMKDLLKQDRRRSVVNICPTLTFVFLMGYMRLLTVCFIHFSCVVERERSSSNIGLFYKDWSIICVAHNF